MDLVIPVDWSESVPIPYLEYGEFTPVCALTGQIPEETKTKSADKAVICLKIFFIEFNNPGQSAKNQIRYCKNTAFGFYIKNFRITSG